MCQMCDEGAATLGAETTFPWKGASLRRQNPVCWESSSHSESSEAEMTGRAQTVQDLLDHMAIV